METAEIPGVSVFPADEHNQALVANVRPPDWTDPDPQPRYNLVVIGAGTGGLVTAAGAAGLGARVALVERHLLGGDCLNVGCVPSKCLIRSARAAAQVRDAARFGVSVPEGVEVDFRAVMKRMRRLRAGISRNDSAERFKSLGVDLFLGAGRFTGPETVEVNGKTLRFRNAVIATGARAAAPAIPGLAEAGYLTNETVFSLSRLPARLAVVGAGPIGCEMAQAFRRFGAQVFLLEGRAQILTREDPDAARIVQAAFVRDGITLELGCTVSQVGREESAKTIDVKCGEKSRRIVVDEILVGVGRAPNLEGLNLEAAGVDYDPRTGVLVNDFLQTSNSRVYAVGDICFPYKFTHTADALARIVLQNALFLGRKKSSALTIPWCTYTDPELAHVGMYEAQAKTEGFEVQTISIPFSEVDRAVADGDEEGLLKVHLRKGSDKILGATIVARHAGDMISEITLAMVGKLGLGTIASVIHPYPTQAEAVRKAADAYNRSRLTPTVKKWFARWLSLRR